jgi:hypothetical protein
VELDVGHVTTYTWHWPSKIHHELVVGGVGSVKKNWFLCLPCSECGRTLSMNMEQKEIHQWGEMDGTPIIIEKGYGQ